MFAAGGFLTGWKGISLLATGVAVAAILGGTGYLGSLNSEPVIDRADDKFLDLNSSAILLHRLHKEPASRKADFFLKKAEMHFFTNDAAVRYLE
jgi:hypothetical protein